MASRVKRFVDSVLWRNIAYTIIVIEDKDLNGDGSKEVWVTSICLLGKGRRGFSMLSWEGKKSWLDLSQFF